MKPGDLKCPRFPWREREARPGLGWGVPTVHSVSCSCHQSAIPVAKVSHLTQWKFSSYTCLSTASWKTNSLLYKDLARLNVLLCMKYSQAMASVLREEWFQFSPKAITVLPVQLPSITFVSEDMSYFSLLGIRIALVLRSYYHHVLVCLLKCR